VTTPAATDYVIALSTVAKPEDAQRIARSLIEQRLAACVNIVPGLLSVYRWKGNIESEGEHLLVIKTRRDRIEALRAALVSLHPYDVPELVVLPVEAGHAPYLAWIDESLGA
jgi:periplasmic divalent cation tolerance protein